MRSLLDDAKKTAGALQSKLDDSILETHSILKARLTSVDFH